MLPFVTSFSLIFGTVATLLIASPGHAAPAAGESAAAPAKAATKPAQPAKATSIPEPDTIALFLLGAGGLVLGRRMSRSKHRRPS